MKSESRMIRVIYSFYFLTALFLCLYGVSHLSSGEEIEKKKIISIDFRSIS